MRCLPQPPCRNSRAFPQQIKEEIKELLRKQPLTPADIASQIEADKEIISQCIRELLEEGDLKTVNGIISLRA